MKRAFTLLALVVLLGSRADADDNGRPDENSLFGGAAASSESATAAVPTESPSPAPDATSADRDANALSNANPNKDEFSSGEATDNPLTIGGTYYQQLNMSAIQGEGAGDSSLTMPLQLDTFLDARPDDRIRGFVDARLLYDPTRDAYGNVTSGTSQTYSSVTGTQAVVNPEVVYDQAWIKFDLADSVFVTAGKQHVKWGASHTWNPTDFLTTQKFNPLLPYDTRLGNTMVKVEVPWQKELTNFYAIALFDNPEPASTLQQIGGAFRAETVLWSAEIGLDAVTRAGVAPSYGADISAPLGPFDVYGEAAFLTGNSNLVESISGLPAQGQDLSTVLSVSGIPAPALQTSGGLNYSFAYLPNREATLGLEYFYNELGASNADIYPVLLYQGNYQPFYLGKNYASFYLTADGFDSNKETSYTFSTISNISDGSYVSRLDFAWLMLSYLTIGAFADAHYGNQGGEFNFSVNTAQYGNPIIYQGHAIQPFSVPSTPFDLGLSLRLGY